MIVTLHAGFLNWAFDDSHRDAAATQTLWFFFFCPANMKLGQLDKGQHFSVQWQRCTCLHLRTVFKSKSLGKVFSRMHPNMLRIAILRVREDAIVHIRYSDTPSRGRPVVPVASNRIG